MRATTVIAILAAGLSWPVIAALPPEERYSWWCNITTPVDGDPHHFLVNGRDAWERNAVMVCSSSTLEFTQKVKVRFESYNEGYGAGHRAKLSLNLTVWTKRAPFRFYSLVTGLVDNSLVHWQFRNEKYELMGTVWTAGQYNARHSLSLGSLRIEPEEI